MIQTEKETVRTLQVREGIPPCTLQASRALLPKQWDRQKQRGRFHASEVSP